jgi:hypothetical protein
MKGLHYAAPSLCAPSMDAILEVQVLP